tara:strand:+ start:133 stop:567 length:435 start_codon:yes stop_codon:yes gene_type:complete
MIRIPLKIESSTKKDIIDEYERIIGTLDEFSEKVVLEKFPNFFSRMSKKEKKYLSLLAKVSKLFFDSCFGKTSKEVPISSESRSYIVAALIYLCNPYDIIPDYAPGVGFHDDIMVMNKCIDKIKKKSPELYKQVTTLILNFEGN